MVLVFSRQKVIFLHLSSSAGWISQSAISVEFGRACTDPGLCRSISRELPFSCDDVSDVRCESDASDYSFKHCDHISV